jgi:TetR/AcrR family transcriptional regulator
MARKSSAEPAHRKEPAAKANSRERILRAALHEFAAQGLQGARIDLIARRAKTNKQLLYYYFGDKEGLYLNVLEHVYAEIRQKELDLKLSGYDPVQAVATLVGFTFDYVIENRDFVCLLINENIEKARFVRSSKVIKKTGTPILKLLRDTVQRGVKLGLFRKNVDPVQLYISMAGLCFFYVGNIHTLSVLFTRDLSRTAALRERRKHVIDFVQGYLAAPARTS